MSKHEAKHRYKLQIQERTEMQARLRNVSSSVSNVLKNTQTESCENGLTLSWWYEEITQPD